MGEILEQMRSANWTAILKSLVFNGGGSSTRWVFLASFLVLSMGYLGIVFVACCIYWRDPSHPYMMMIAVVLPLAGIIGGFSANAQNIRHQLTAQAQSAIPINASSTPATSDVGGKAPDVQ